MSDEKKFLLVGLKDKLSNEPVFPFGKFYENQSVLRRDFHEIFKDSAIRSDIDVIFLGYWNANLSLFENVDSHVVLFNIGDLYE